MQHYYRKLIKDWVNKCYGESEANNPSWDINALAKMLSDKLFDICRERDAQYVIEDLDYYLTDGEAKPPRYKLTTRQKNAIADDIMHSDWYGRIEPDDFEYYIKKELETK